QNLKMQKVVPIAQNQGFNNGGKQGEYFYSQGMRRSQFGLVPAWKTVLSNDQTTIATLGLVRAFAQAVVSGTTYVFGLDDVGNILKSPIGVVNYSLEYNIPEASGPASSGNGLIADQKGRLLYFSNQYLGKYDPTVSNYSTGTLDATFGSPNLVGTGTTWTASMVGKKISINGGTKYRITNFTDATHIRIAPDYDTYGEITVTG